MLKGFLLVKMKTTGKTIWNRTGLFLVAERKASQSEEGFEIERVVMNDFCALSD